MPYVNRMLDDWDESPITAAEIEDLAHDTEAGWTEPLAKRLFRTLYWVATGIIGSVALLSEEARFVAAVGVCILLVFGPTFEESLK